MRKILGLFVLAFAVLGLAACSSKDANGIPNVLQDKYTGYSTNPGSSLAFSEGGSTISFNKKNNTITNETEDESIKFTVIPEDKLNSYNKGVLNKHKAELYGKDYFLFTDSEKYQDGSYVYAAILTDGGKTIRIFEFENTGTADDYLYDFTGQAD